MDYEVLKKRAQKLTDSFTQSTKGSTMISAEDIVSDAYILVMEKYGSFSFESFENELTNALSIENKSITNLEKQKKRFDDVNKYRFEHPDEYRKYLKKYKEENKEKLKAYRDSINDLLIRRAHKWNQENPDRVKKNMSAYQASEKGKAAKKAYKKSEKGKAANIRGVQNYIENHPEKWVEIQKNHQRRLTQELPDSYIRGILKLKGYTKEDIDLHPELIIEQREITLARRREKEFKKSKQTNMYE